MTKTTLNPKVSSYKSDSLKDTPSPKALKDEFGNNDKYVNPAPNKYKGLVTGTTSQEPSLIEDMLSANEQMSKISKEPIQDLIGYLMTDDSGPKPSADTDFQALNVPDFHKDVLSQGSQTGMLAYVTKYQGLEKTILKLKSENSKALDPKSSAFMTADEIASLRDYSYQLDSALLNCRIQLKEATYYHNWELKDKAAYEEEQKNIDETS